MSKLWGVLRGVVVCEEREVGSSSISVSCCVCWGCFRIVYFGVVRWKKEGEKDKVWGVRVEDIDRIILGWGWIVGELIDLGVKILLLEEDVYEGLWLEN